MMGQMRSVSVTIPSVAARMRRSAAFAPVFGVDILFRHQPAQVKNHPDAETALQSESYSCGNVTARMDHLDPVTTNERARFAIAGDYVVGRRGYRWSLMITQPVPFDALGFQLRAQLFAVRNAFGRKRFRPFETQQRKLHSAPRQLAQVRQHLALAERVKHAVVRDE